MQTRAGMSVNSYWSLCVVRFFLGFGGAAFVVTQSRGRADFFPAGRGDTAGAARIVAGRGGAAVGRADRPGRDAATPVRARPR